MPSTAPGPAIDVGPRVARPGLALLLALLSVPGSTVAWELPAGGFWIGVPLAAAAIVLGLRARSRLPGGPGSRMALAAIAVAALMIGMTAIWTVASLLS
jgi:hypothetical protein